MFVKRYSPYPVIGLQEAIDGEETKKTSNYKSVPSMVQAKRVSAKEDFEYRPHSPKKIKYGSKDIEV